MSSSRIKTRLERLSKADRDYIVSFVTETHTNLFPQLNEFLPDQAAAYERRYIARKEAEAGSGERVQSHQDSFLTLMWQLKFYLENLALKARFIDNDITLFVNLGRIKGRIEYLQHLVGGEEDSGSDCYHVWGLLWSLAFADFDAAQSCANRWPDDSKQGHRTTKAMCNGVTSLLHGRRMPDALERALGQKLGVNESAELNCLAAIFTQDEHRFECELDRSLGSYKATAALEAVKKYFCWRAHGLLRLARLLHGETFAAAFVPKSPLWDFDLERIEAGQPDTAILSDYSEQLVELIETIPINPPSDLFASLRLH